MEEESFDFDGMLYKRRGGFGKMMPNAWQYRYFILKHGVFTYYEQDHVGTPTTKARGKMDLKAMRYDVKISAPIDNSPTQYTVQIHPNPGEAWKMCAPSEEDMMKWSTCLEHYEHINVEAGTGKVVYDSDEDTTTRRRSFSGNSTKPPVIAQRNALTSPSSTPGKQRMFSSPIQTPMTAMTATSAVAATPDADSANPSARPKQGKKGLKLKKEVSGNETMEMISTIMIVNLCAYIACNYSNWIGIPMMIFSNAIVGYTLILRSERLVNATKAHDLEVDNMKKSQQISRKISIEYAGAASIKQPKEEEPSCNNQLVDGKPKAGSTFPQVCLHACTCRGWLS